MTTGTYELTFDEAEAIGLDGTGRDLNPSFPYKYHALTDEQKVKFWQFRLVGAGLNRDVADEIGSAVKKIAAGLNDLVYAWGANDLPYDFIVPELGLPISMSFDEAAIEVNDLGDHIREAGIEAFRYTGKHRVRV